MKFGDDHALDALIRNEGADVSRTSMEAAVDRARRNALLHEGVVDAQRPAARSAQRNVFRRRDEPARADHAAQRLGRSRHARRRARQGARAHAPDRRRPAAPKPRTRWRSSSRRRPAGELNARLLVSLYREAKQTHFLYGLAEVTNLDPDTVADLLERQDIDGLAMICRAAGIERPLFVTLAVLTCGGEEAMDRAEEFGRMYNNVPVEAAQRAMRFFKVRKGARRLRPRVPSRR